MRLGIYLLATKVIDTLRLSHFLGSELVLWLRWLNLIKVSCYNSSCVKLCTHFFTQTTGSYHKLFDYLCFRSNSIREVKIWTWMTSSSYTVSTSNILVEVTVYGLRVVQSCFCHENHCCQCSTFDWWGMRQKGERPFVWNVVTIMYKLHLILTYHSCLSHKTRPGSGIQQEYSYKTALSHKHDSEKSHRNNGS